MRGVKEEEGATVPNVRKGGQDGDEGVAGT